MPENYGHLSRQLKYEVDRVAGWAKSEYLKTSWVPGIEALIPEFTRLERIVSALESIGVNLDAPDIVALELIASDPNYADYKVEFYEVANNLVRHTQDTERDHEQDQATEALAAAGFALDDEDGETWTKDRTTVKVECVHPAESRYRWEYYSGHICEIGVSGEFHRLLKLIAPVDSDSACGVSPSGDPCKTVGTIAWPGGGGIPKGPIDIVCGPGATIDLDAFSAHTVTETPTTEAL